MAQRIQLKRSSINGKRPEGRYLEPGEIALNTNGSNSGLFFEANDGTIMKVGPVAITTTGEPPSLTNTLAEYSPGELWWDATDGEGVLKVYTENGWTSVWNGATSGVTPGSINRDLLPYITDQYDVGSTDKRFSNAYAASVHADNVYTGDLLPHITDQYDIGSTDKRFSNVYANNVYTGDLHMKNDRGDWTAIEEEDFLSLRNNKTGKRYRIMMEEIEEG